MNKKEYSTPIMETYQIKAQSLLTGSVLDPTLTDPVVTPTPEPFNGEFSVPVLDMGMMDLMTE